MHWLIAILALTGTTANIYKKRWCFICWIISNTSFAYIDFTNNIPAQGWLFVIYTVLAIFGWLKWRR